MMRAMFFAPFVIIYAIIFFVILAFLFVLLEVGVIHHAFIAVGLPPELAFLALFASLIGSYINIPLAKIASGPPHRLEDQARSTASSRPASSRYCWRNRGSSRIIDLRVRGVSRAL